MVKRCNFCDNPAHGKNSCWEMGLYKVVKTTDLNHQPFVFSFGEGDVFSRHVLTISYYQSPAASKINVGRFRIIMKLYMAYENLTSSHQSYGWFFGDLTYRTPTIFFGGVLHPCCSFLRCAFHFCFVVTPSLRLPSRPSARNHNRWQKTVGSPSAGVAIGFL